MRFNDLNVMPESLVLVRHGESESNLAKSNFEHGVPFARESEMMAVHTSERRLTPLGIDQAKEAGAWLRRHWLDTTIPQHEYRFFASPYVRAMETAGHLRLGAYAQWIRDSRIVERNWGDLDQMTHAERMERFAQELEDRKDRAFFWRPMNGETFQDVFNRLYLMKERMRRSPARRMIVVCHGETMWVWRKLLEKWSPHDLRTRMLRQDGRTRIHNCRIIEYSRRDMNGALQMSPARVRLVNPADPRDQETNLDWQAIDRSRWSDDDLLEFVESFPCFLEAA